MKNFHRLVEQKGNKTILRLEIKKKKFSVTHKHIKGRWQNAAAAASETHFVYTRSQNKWDKKGGCTVVKCKGKYTKECYSQFVVVSLKRLCYSYFTTSNK